MKHTVLLALTCTVFVLLLGALVSVTPARAGQFPATGQTTAYPADKNDGITGGVEVPDDGTLQRGAALDYKVLKDGTIKDLNTGLIWEVKCSEGCGGLHDEFNLYRWSGDGSQETIWDWLEDINAEGGTGYAGHNDWRIPNERELLSIVDYGVVNLMVDPIFIPTRSLGYWSSTTSATNPSSAWYVGFTLGGGDGDIKVIDKSNMLFVRAVRGGPK